MSNGEESNVDLLDGPSAIPEKLCNLPPFHGVANQIFTLSVDPNVDLRRIAVLIERDVAFASEILLLANSPLFGFQARVHAVRHAVAILGLERMKTLAVTVAMRAFLGAETPLVGVCWRHTAACALICQRLSTEFGIPQDLAYTAGLLHDVGRLGLLKSYPEEIAPVFRCTYLNAAEVLRLERGLVHVDHGTAGAWLLKVWALPEAFAEICARHHDPLDRSDSDLLQLVKVGCQLANVIGSPAVQYRDSVGYEELLAGTGRKGFPTLEELQTHVEERLSAFGH